MIKKTQHLLYLYFSIGTNKNTSINELKKIQLLHIFCNTWHLFTLFSIIEDISKNKLKIYSYIIMFLLAGSVQVSMYYTKHTLARILFLVNLFNVVLFFSNYIYVGELLEYYFLLVPSIALIFIDNKKVNIAILVICLLGLFVPNLYFKHYSLSVLNNMNPAFLFFSVFIVISYFKNLNIRNEKKLEAKTKELEELDQFKSHFFTNISHEIRTPLTLINGYNSELKNLNKAEEIHKKIDGQIHKITNIVDSVLDLAKMQSSNFSLQLKPTNISNIIRQISMNFKPLFEQKGLFLKIKDTNTDCFSETDSIFLEKAINNIMVNALKYTDKGGVTLKISKKNSEITLKITDTGIGISNNNLKNVFKRFYQVNNDINKAGGSGIGLAFCKEIIELHNGTITLQSKKHIGSVFTITLPILKNAPVITTINKAEETDDFEETEEHITLTPLSNYIILIVDDNFEMRKYLTSILKDYTCIEASNGEDALTLINSEKIDFIISDYMMPKLNGHDLIIKLKEIKITTPVIMLTAKTDINTKIDVLKLGIDDYITKPFNKQELLVRVHNSLKNHTAKEAYNSENNIIITSIRKVSFIDELKNYILKNSQNTSLSQDDIAKALNISKSSFYRKIKSNTGMSPNNFIREIRLQKARDILQNDPNITIKELSFQVGFNHTSYFAKVYESRFGVSPIKNK